MICLGCLDNGLTLELKQRVLRQLVLKHTMFSADKWEIITEETLAKRFLLVVAFKETFTQAAFLCSKIQQLAIIHFIAQALRQQGGNFPATTAKLSAHCYDNVRSVHCYNVFCLLILRINKTMITAVTNADMVSATGIDHHTPSTP